MNGERGAPIDIGARPRPGRQVGGGGGGGALGIPGQHGVPTFVAAAPWTERPPGATDFNLADTLTARTSANTPALFPNAQFRIPQGQVGVIRSFLILANGLLVTSDIQWTLLFDNNPAPGWAGLTINPRAAGSVEQAWVPEETYIFCPEGAVIDWRVLVVDAGTYQVSINYHGWYYPSSLHMAALNSWG